MLSRKLMFIGRKKLISSFKMEKSREILMNKR